MPLEDPRRDGSRRDGLRIGGWLEASQVRRALPGRPPLVTPPPPRVPVFRPVRSREAGRRPLALPVLSRAADPRQVRLRVAVTCLVALAVGGTTFAVLADRAGTAPAIAQISVGDPVTLGPMPFSPSHSPAPSHSPSPTPSRSPRHAVSSAPPRQAPAPVHHTSSAAPRPSSSRPATIGGVRVGGTLALTSRSRYVVHAATPECVTLESARYPGFYLRAGDRSVRLDRSGGSAFCPVPAGDGTVRLRSAARPDSYLVAFRSRLYLASVPPSRATAFTPS